MMLYLGRNIHFGSEVVYTGIFQISNLFIFSGLQGKQQEMKYYISKHKLTTRDEIIICIHDK